MMDSVTDFKNTIDSLVDAKLDQRGITRFVSAKVTSVNVDNTVNVYILPDTTKTVSNVLNKTGELLSVGDSVELGTKNGKINNAWVALKHGTNLLGAFLPLSGGNVTGSTTFQSDLNVTNTYGSFDVRDSNWGNSTILNDYTGDVNNLLTSGWFPTGSSNTNLPTAHSYMIQVMVKNPTYYIRQIAYRREGSYDIYTRYRIDETTWSDWQKLPQTTTDINTLYGSSLIGKFTNMTGVNFNNYKGSGVYGFYGSNTNSPTSTIGILEVLSYSGDWVIQRVTSIGETPHLYERHFHSGTTWTAWFTRW